MPRRIPRGKPGSYEDIAREDGASHPPGDEEHSTSGLDSSKESILSVEDVRNVSNGDMGSVKDGNLAMDHARTSRSSCKRKHLNENRKFEHSNSSLLLNCNESDVVAPILPDSPFPVDQYHFHCFGTTKKTLHHLGDALQRLEIDFLFNSSKCKYKCSKIVEYESLEFVIRVFRKNGSNTFQSESSTASSLLVEFQRRTGKILVWDTLYRSIYNEMIDHIDELIPVESVVNDSSIVNGRKRRRKVVGRKLPRCSSPHCKDSILGKTNSSAENSIRPVILMTQSSFVDIRREGISCLAALTNKKEKVESLLKESLAIETVLKCMDSLDEATRRCAVSVVANIAKVLDEDMYTRDLNAVRGKLACGASKIVTILSGLSCNKDERETERAFMVSLELQRECARALMHLGSVSVCPDDVSKDGVEQLKLRQMCKDVRLATQSKEAISNLC